MRPRIVDLDEHGVGDAPARRRLSFGARVGDDQRSAAAPDLRPVTSRCREFHGTMRHSADHVRPRADVRARDHAFEHERVLGYELLRVFKRGEHSHRAHRLGRAIQESPSHEQATVSMPLPGTGKVTLQDLRSESPRLIERRVLRL
jgi:hypothetical protein